MFKATMNESSCMIYNFQKHSLSIMGAAID